jgi:hypothetical protein
MKPKDLPLFRDKQAREVLEDACKRHGISLSLLQRLLEIQRQFAGSGRQMGITSEFDSAFIDSLEEEER